MKLAMLLGCSGAGKGYIVDRVSQSAQRIVVDLVRRDVLEPLRELLKDDEVNRWKVWDALTSRFDVAPAIAAAITERYGELKEGSSIIAEGGLLAHTEFQAAFVKAFRLLGREIERRHLFWIDPEPKVVFDNRKHRFEHGGRRSDDDFTVEEAERLVDWYRSKALTHECERSSNAEHLIAAINSFLME